MFYHVIIPAFGLICIVGTLYFSHALSRSPVRRVGTVRTSPDVEAEPHDDTTDAHAEAGLTWVQYDLDERGKALLKKAWKCEQCGLIQSGDKDRRCRRCAQDAF